MFVQRCATPALDDAWTESAAGQGCCSKWRIFNSFLGGLKVTKPPENAAILIVPLEVEWTVCWIARMCRL